MKRWPALTLSLLGLLLHTTARAADATVQNSQVCSHAITGLRLATGELKLPPTGWWYIPAETQDLPGLRQLVLVPGDDEEVEPPKVPASYRIIGQLTGPTPPAQVDITVTNAQTDAKLTCSWSLRDAPQADNGPVAKAWAEHQVSAWWGYGRHAATSPLLRAWLVARNTQFGVSTEYVLRNGGMPQDSDERALSVFSMLGGRAAIQETLQLQALRRAPGQAQAPAANDVPVEQLPGVQVKSHPFAEMLKGAAGGRLPLADSVPNDRFFAYFARPAAFLAFLNAGSDFLFQTGTLAAGSSLDYDLKNRYLHRLGLDENWLNLLLNSGAVSELALFTPDLFLLDGTEITVVARLPQAALLKPLLAAAGVGTLTDREVTVAKSAAGPEVFWSCAGDLLFISTAKAEITAALTLTRPLAAGSLGQSAEFRYMLTQLPISKTTRAYAYFSDPFIRRLVGPAVKIAQLRRLLARADLETITGGALLYQADQGTEAPDLTTLKAKGYLPKELPLEDYRLKPGGFAASPTWGTAANLEPLSRQPVTTVTPAEADAYRQYMDRYSEYWRRYFDPIALRLDDAPDGSLELSTFILPLLENDLYNQVRKVLGGAVKGAVLRLPQLQPQPVLLLSLRFNDEARAGWLNEIANPAARGPQTLPPDLVAELGATVHLAIQDADPIIALGSGDILGALGGDALRIGRGSEMLAIPVLLSVLTRPCAFFMELRNPAKVREILARGPLLQMPSSEFQLAVCRVAGRDAWLYTVSLANIVKLRFGLEVSGQYLVVSNLPWSQKLQVTGMTEAVCSTAALQVRPGAIDKQLAALYMNQVDQQREAAMQGINCLGPLVSALGCKSAADASALHLRLFGFAPLHPAGGGWQLAGNSLKSSVFGSPYEQVIPDYGNAKRDFGLFTSVPNVQLSMQFEDTGLRSVCRWKYQAPSMPAVPAGK